MRLRILTPVFVISILLSNACIENESAEKMPVTTDSELALEFYETGMVAFDQLKWGLAMHNFELAVKEDSDLFMAYFWMYIISSKESKKVAEKALQTNATLNEAEKHIKTAFKYLLDGQNEKVLEHLQMAVDLYPSDPEIHKSLYIPQFLILKDAEGTIESTNRAIKINPDYALAYNYLGYALMDLEEYDRAEEAIDNYIKLAPTLANPYDSKGDFYMNTQQYGKAYESYLKAFNLDSGFIVSEKKAIKAKQLQSKISE